MIVPMQPLLIDAESPVGFHCAIHGTVTRCPYTFMACTDTEPPQGRWHPSWETSQRLRYQEEIESNGSHEPGDVR